MNHNDKDYRKFFLIREMLEVKQVLSRMDTCRIFEFAPYIKNKKVLLTGEGSSRIFPAKKVIYDAMVHRYQETIITEGASQAAEYDLEAYTVFVASNSGKTREVIHLIESLRQRKHQSILAVVAHENTPVFNGADERYLLKSGQEQAVAATKTVVEQALFYDILFRKSNDQTLPDLVCLGDLMDQVLTSKIPEKIIEQLAGAGMLCFAGRNNGVSEELALKTNEIPRKKSDYFEGTYAVHGVEEVLSQEDIIILIDPFPQEASKIQKTLVEGLGAIVLAISHVKTPFPTLEIPDYGEFTPYLALAMGWNLLVETALKQGIDIDHPIRARKIGNEFDPGISI